MKIISKLLCSFWVVTLLTMLSFILPVGVSGLSISPIVYGEQMDVGIAYDGASSSTFDYDLTSAHTTNEKANQTRTETAFGNLSEFLAAEEASLAVGESNIRWVSESVTMDEGALAYQSGAAGAREGMAPALVGPGGNLVKFDGFEGSTLIDRKLSVTTFPKSQWQAFRQSQALQANGFTGRWEVPTQAEANRAIQMFNRLGINNISVVVAPR